MQRMTMPNLTRPAVVSARMTAPRATIAKIGSVTKPVLVGQPVVSERGYELASNNFDEYNFCSYCLLFCETHVSLEIVIV